MANYICEVVLTEDRLKAPERDITEAGAVIDFLGVVRRLEEDVRSKESTTKRTAKWLNTS